MKKSEMVTKLVEEERGKQGLTGKALEKMSGVSIRAINGWKSREHGMYLDSADKVLKALNVEVTIGGKK